MLEELKKAIKVQEEREKVYGQNYVVHGDVMLALFPDGVNLKTKEEHRRFGVLTQIVGKLTRYANQFSNGGHRDSAKDMIVYSALLEKLTK